MDKKWISPTVNEVEVKETAYGGTITKEFDDVFVNKETGKWEATFVKDPS